MEGLPVTRKAIALAWLGGALGCGTRDLPYRLEGSLSVLIDLRYQKTYLDLSPEELAVRFVTPQGEGEDTVLKVTASLLGAAVEAEDPIDLAEDTPEGKQRGVVSRNVLADESNRSFPRLERGRLVFLRAPVSGSKVPGEVSVTFANGNQLASGRTLYGSFQAEVP